MRWWLVAGAAAGVGVIGYLVWRAHASSSTSVPSNATTTSSASSVPPAYSARSVTPVGAALYSVVSPTSTSPWVVRQR